jgi:hypothetical protein
MVFANEFADMASATIQHFPIVSRDGYGKPTYGTAVPYKAREAFKTRMVRDKEGQEVTSTAQVWIIGAPVIDPEDRVLMSDGKERTIASVDRPTDEISVAYTKVYFL